ncbi:MAG TPA: phage tail protein [Anaerolineae bacterium]|nr:phage tail protein [Anaerolineae bacterium]
MSLDRPLEPAAGYRFGVEIQGLVVGWFTECSGLSFERAVLPYEEGGINDRVHQLPGRIKRANLSLKRGLADSRLMAWFLEGQQDGGVKRRDVSIILCNADGAEMQRWDLIGVYPLKWQGPGPVTGSDQVAVETIEIGSDDGSVESTTVQRAGGRPRGATDEDVSRELEVDLPALAQRVVELLKQDLRVERERLPRTDRYSRSPW